LCFFNWKCHKQTKKYSEENHTNKSNAQYYNQNVQRWYFEP